MRGFHLLFRISFGRSLTFSFQFLTGPFLPIWQCYPVIPYYPIYNWDILGYDNIDFMNRIFDTHRPRLDTAYMIAEPGDLETMENNEWDADWAKDYIDPDEEPMEPVSDIYYPLLEDSISHMDVFEDGGYMPLNNATFKGILALSIYWRDLLRDILPAGRDGVLIVVDNPCNPTFTYEINGPTVVYLGTIDAHDPEYNHLEIASSFLDLRKFAVKNSKYSGLPLDDEYCPFRVRIYPSHTKKDQYTTTDSTIFAIAAASIFLFTSAVFVLYDFCVERRQRLVMNTAVKSTAIVSSLFPENVRDRMYDERDKKADKSEAQKNFMASHGVEESLEQIIQSSRPIAELYPAATVFFADIA